MRPTFAIPFVATFALLAGCAHTAAISPGASRTSSAASATSTTSTTPAPTPADTVIYRGMRARLRGFATMPGAADSVRAFDVDALRRAHAASSDYDPYGSDSDLRQAMFQALDRGAWADGRRLADSALAVNYLDVFAHLGAAVASDKLRDATRSQFHQAMMRALIGAILASGAGTKESPWVVLSVDEEYAVLQARGLSRETQAVVECAGDHECDVLSVVGRDGGAPSSVYFDITTPKRWLTRKFEAAATERKP